MKRKEKRIINFEEDFYEKNNIKNNYYIEYKTLNQCYERCSSRKQFVYNYYKELLKKNSDKVLEYGIRSYNSMIIILHSIVEKDGKKYYLLITPSHNYYQELTNEEE